MLKELFENTFLSELQEIERGKFIEPNAEARPEDNIVGEMDELEKAIYTLSNKKAKLAGMSVLQLSFESLNSDEKTCLTHAALSLKTQSENLKELMWTLIKDRLNLWDRSIGIRRGFKVVWVDEKRMMDNARDLLSLILGKPDD